MDSQRYDFIIGMQSKELKAEATKVKGDLKGLAKAFRDTISVLNTPPKGIGITKELDRAKASAKAALAEVKKLQAAGKTNLSNAGISARQRASIRGGIQETASNISAAQPSAIKAKELAASAKATRELQNRGITLRYALYDVASAAQAASQSLLGYASATVMAAAAQEQAFSKIQKTLGNVSTEELNKLRQELLALSTQIPVSFNDLATIGMLGSQMGIAADDIAAFTETVAKFSSLTGMNVEDTAMAFGKIGGILGLTADQYESLGSAIAAVGFDSKATEAQIVSTAGQIGAVAKAAGLSASEVIGLSAAFASLKIAPEEARGVIVRTFNEISKAAGSFSTVTGVGSERLQRFAEIAGISSADFVKGWGDKSPEGASKVWQKFITGLSTRDISTELRQLGLDGVRTSKGLTALASDVEAIFGKGGNGGLIALAKTAGTEGTFLDKSFGVIVDDLVSKLAMLQNSFENLFAAAANNGPLLSVLKSAIDFTIRFNEALTSLANKNQFVATLVQLSILAATLAGLFLALGAAAALSGASFQALRTAWAATQVMGLSLGKFVMWLKEQLIALRATSAAASSGFVGMGAGANIAAGGIFTAATALRVFKLALAATGIGLAVVLIGELAAAFMNTFGSSDEAARGLDELNKELNKVQAEAEKAKSELIDFINKGLEPIMDASAAQESLFKLGQALRENGKNWSQYSTSGRANIAALDGTIKAFAQNFGGDSQELANQLLALKTYMIEMGMGGQLAFAMLDGAIAETGKVAVAAVGNFASLDDGFTNIAAGAGRVQTALEKMTEAFDKAFEKFNQRMELESTLDDFGKSLTENGKKLNIFTDSGRANVSALMKVIYSLKNRLAGNPQSLANSLASLREAMIRMGITSKAAFKMVDLAMSATGKKGKALKKVIDSLFGAISQSAEDSKPLRTITDYVNELSSVLDDAFNNRYAKQNASDSISSAWISIKESAQDAKKAIDDANASINEMQADKGILEYQLKVAIRYGDTLRAESIKAKLAKLNDQLIGKQADLADAQAQSNKSLVGNSKYAIENRSQVLGLVQGYNDYLVSLAASGMSSKDLKKKAAELANEFLAQGEQMGFARSELLTYTDAFKKDFTTVINNLPKDITLNMVTDPALQAVIDFVKDANAELAKLLSGTVNVDISSNIGGGVGGNGARSSAGGASSGSVGNGGNRGGLSGQQEAAALVDQRRSALNTVTGKANTIQSDIEKSRAAIAKLEMDVTFASANNKPAKRLLLEQMRKVLTTQLARKNALTPEIIRNVNRLEAAQAVIKKKPKAPVKKKVPTGARMAFAGGGLVRGSGSGTSDSINAMVSNGEYIVRANAVKYYGTEFMNSLNQMGMNKPVPQGGKSNVIYLSPDDRALLRAAIDRPIALYTENTTIAKSANAGNVILAQRGSR